MGDGAYGEGAYDRVVWTACHVNCGSRCPLRAYVKDGVVARVDIDDEGPDGFGPGEVSQLRSCVRGHTARQRLYSPTRVRTPLKRVEGTKRGEGAYEPISWDEALDLVADAMRSVKAQYGNDAFYIQYGTGEIGATVARSCSADKTAFARLMNCWGGYLRHYGDYSTGQIAQELPLLTGDAWSNNETADLVRSRHILLFGENPANTRMSGSSTWRGLAEVRRRNPGADVVVIDPILSDTAAGLADEWVPVRPGTDDALVAGMLFHLLRAGALDERRVRERTCGFFSDTFFEDVRAAEPTSSHFFGYDRDGRLPAVERDMSYEAYLLGRGAYAGTGEKTPEWAAGVTGVPAATVRRLAEACADGPTAIVQGWGPQRHSNGGNLSRAIGLLAAVTGNAGIPGGGTGARGEEVGAPFHVARSIPALQDRNGVENCISFFTWPQAIEDFRSMTDATWGVRRYVGGELRHAEEPGAIRLKAPIKFIWNYGSNVMAGQHADINDMLRVYNLPDEEGSGLRMVVTVDAFLTPTALVSDIVLPGTTPFEEDDITSGGGAWTGFVLYETAAVEPLFESKPVYEICELLAGRLGVREEFTAGRDQRGWLRWCYEQGVAAGDPLPPTFEEFRRVGLVKRADRHEPFVPRPEPGGLGTPSGRYEVFSKQAYNISLQWDPTCGGAVPDDGCDAITPLPVHCASFEGPEDPLRAERPFQLIGHHTKARTHSSYGNVPWMEEVAPQQCWVNSADAERLGVRQGDEVVVETERGRTRLPAKVTPRIMPGAVSVPQGAWYRPASREAEAVGDRGTLDLGGCVSVLTSNRPTPISKGNGVHSNLCRVERAGGGPAGDGAAGRRAVREAERAAETARDWAGGGRAGVEGGCPAAAEGARGSVVGAPAPTDAPAPAGGGPARYGFFVDADLCAGCKACMTACFERNALEPPQKLRRVYELGGGAWEDAGGGALATTAFAYYVSLTCGQCTRPACVEACPTGAMRKDPATGIVRVDRAACTGCMACARACPAGHPVRASDGLARKCEMCLGEGPGGAPDPACAKACPVRAIEFGPLDELRARHPGAFSPGPRAAGGTSPGLVFKPHRSASRGGSLLNPLEV